MSTCKDGTYIWTKQAGYVLYSASVISLVGFSAKALSHIISETEFEQVDAGLVRVSIVDVEATSISESLLLRSSI